MGGPGFPSFFSRENKSVPFFVVPFFCFIKGKRQNQLTEENIAKIIETYQFRKEEPRYARRVEMEEIEKNGYNLNISRYINTASAEVEIDLHSVNTKLVTLEKIFRRQGTNTMPS